MATSLFTAAQVREQDRIAIEELGIPGITLMRRAADACVTQIESRWPDLDAITVVCGSGNNAGDGYIIAGILAGRDIKVQVIDVGDRAKLGKDALVAYQYCRDSRADFALADAEYRGELLVDALLGTGLSGPVREEYSDVIRRINGIDKPVLSVDVPSGLCADTGTALGISIVADVTLTFIGRKRGLYTNDGPDLSGEVVFDSLGVPEESVFQPKQTEENQKKQAAVFMMERPRLPRRSRNSHKKSHGHVLVIGGNHGMGGAALMCAEAALRTGAGIVSVATRDENTAPLLVRCPEVMALGVKGRQDLDKMLERATAVVVGPGLGLDAWAEELFDAALESELPVLIDADGLTLLAKTFFEGCVMLSQKSAQKSGVKNDKQNTNWVLTPHPGEAARLLSGALSGAKDLASGESELSRVLASGIQADRFQSIRLLQENYGGTLVLKGAGTLVSDGKETRLCPLGNPGMATAGMGDVLSGIIGGLLAQGVDCFAAATAGVFLHAKAGDMVAEAHGEKGMLATDLIPIVRQLIND